mgnify:CR=1 FL=1
MENLSHIFISSNFLNSLPDEIKSNKEALYKHLVNENISNYIDKEKVKAYFNSELYNLEEPLQKIENKYIFCQVISVRNIAISKEEAKYKEYDNLDEIEDEDNDIDDNKYLQGNDEKNQKTSKIIYKFEFTSTGDDLFYGFEYNQFSHQTHDKLSNITKSNLLKILLGPNIEVRRGIFYLNDSNFKILS